MFGRLTIVLTDPPFATAETMPAVAVPLSMVGTWLGGFVLDRLSDVNFKRYLRLILSVIGLLYLVQAARLYWLGG